MNLDKSTKLTNLPLPYLDVLLAERFLLPPESLARFGMPIPQDISELAEASGMPLSIVIEILLECIKTNEKVWLTEPLERFLDQSNVWIVDMRPGIDFDVEPLHEVARIFHHGNQAAQLELMRGLEKVIVLSKTPEHAWSAAMSLRQMGVPAFLSSQSTSLSCKFPPALVRAVSHVSLRS